MRVGKGSDEGPSLGATVAIDDMTCDGAVQHAAHRLSEACWSEGLEDRQVVEVRSVEWTRGEAELDSP